MRRRIRSRRGRRPHRRWHGKALASVALAGGAALASYPLWRPWCLHWGATDEEAHRVLPGDSLLPDPDVVTTRGVGLVVPPSAVWPWLVQMGPRRAGAYTYDWIENLMGLDMHSSDEILPQFQHLEVGDAWQLGKNGAVLRVAELDPESALVLRSDDGNWVWSFVLMHRGTGSRLLSRNRIRQPGASWQARALFTYFMEPGSLVMERKMLLGIKQRAERSAGSQPEPANEATEVSSHQSAPSPGSPMPDA